jgi:hypothetical protein
MMGVITWQYCAVVFSENRIAERVARWAIFHFQSLAIALPSIITNKNSYSARSSLIYNLCSVEG